ncbi:MAG TPA: M48 family metallopeptidase [Planctomycetota bacterium]|nr:M48 family metallopeptidase [Planctomycetota bacterium]
MIPDSPKLSSTAWQRELQARSPLPGQSLPRHAVTAAKLPKLESAGGRVEAAACIEPRTGFALGASAVLAAVVALAMIVTIYGALIAVAFFVAEHFARRRARTILNGSTLRVGPQQFPELHECLRTFAQRLGMAEVPELYVVDAGEVNGFALRLGRKNGIFLTDEAVAACLEGRSGGALSFVIGHELAHIALGHHTWWRSTLSKLHWLSRLDECSADNVACELVGSNEAAEDGVLLLVAGPRLLSFVDRAAARAQAAEVAGDRLTRRVERKMTHPLTMHRLHRVARRFAPPPMRKVA